MAAFLSAINPLIFLLFLPARQFSPDNRGLARLVCMRDASTSLLSLQTRPVSPRPAGPVRFGRGARTGNYQGILEPLGRSCDFGP
jgi:hypothetical protein